MIARKIAHHLKRQDWVAVAIEFAIVVLGVYAAFELDRWRETEKDRQANERFLELLSIELAEELPAARRRHDFWLSVRDDQNAAIRWLNDEDSSALFTAEMCRGAFQSGLPAWTPTRLEAARFMADGDRAQDSQDVELRRLLFSLAALQEAGDTVFDRFVFQSAHLPDRFPNLIRRADRAVADYRETLSCDGEAMRASQAFKNQFFSNAGRQNALLGIREDELELLESIATRVGELRN